MRICWIKAGGLVPLDFGGRIRSFQMVKALAERHDVTLMTFYREQSDDPHPALQGLFRELVLVPQRLPAARTAGDFLLYAKTFASGLPHSMAKYYTPALRQRVHAVLRREFDVIVCDFIYPAGLLPWTGPAKTVLFTHNVEAETWERQVRVAAGWTERLASRLESRAMRAAEQKYVALADHVVAVSERNKQILSRYIDAGRITVVSTGVDTEYFRPAPDAERADHVVFTGSYDWMPNRDAAEFYHDEILPAVRAEIPGVQSWMVGKAPSASMRRRAEADPAFHVTGRVDDIRAHLGQCPVYIVPMRSGSGTRLKVFEAMAAGKAIVSTSIGAEGLPVAHEQNILLADTPAEFARQVVRALGDSDLRRRLGAAARALVETRFSWSRVAGEFDAILQRVAPGAPARAAGR